MNNNKKNKAMKANEQIVPIGTKVKVIANKWEHEFKKGQVVIVDRYDGDTPEYKCYNLKRTDHWYLSRDEFEIVEP